MEMINYAGIHSNIYVYSGAGHGEDSTYEIASLDLLPGEHCPSVLV